MTLTATQRQDRIALYGRGYADLEALLATIPVAAWQFKPSPTDWSIHEVIIHLGDSESQSMGRFRRAVAEPGSGVYGYDQDVWAVALNYHARSTAIALSVVKAVREASYELFLSLPEAVFANTVVHSENGVMTLDDLLVTYSNHIPGHIDQIKGVYAAYQNR
jgi:hypothetical protein